MFIISIIRRVCKIYNRDENEQVSFIVSTLDTGIIRVQLYNRCVRVKEEISSIHTLVVIV